jgi:hypothetical protein
MMRTPFFIFAIDFSLMKPEEVIRASDQFVDRHQLDAVFTRYCFRDKRIAADDIESESARAFGHFKPNAAQAENAQRLAAQLGALQILLIPLAGVHRCVGRGNLARKRDHQADGEFGNRNGVGARRIHHHNAAARGRFCINIVNADACAANHAQLGRLLHQRVIHLHGRANHQTICIGKCGGQAFGDLVVRLNIPAGFGLKNSQCCRRNLLSQYDLHPVSLLRGLIVVKTDALLLAEQVEHPYHCRMRLAFAALVIGDGVGVYAQPLGHLILIQAELLAGDEQLFSKSEFWHLRRLLAYCP